MKARYPTTSFAALIAMLGCASPAKAPITSAAAPALQPELQRLSFYVGRWRCQGVGFDDQGKEDERHELEIAVRPELDGSWLSVLVFQEGVQRTAELKGFDHDAKRYRHLWASNNGEWGTLSSTGWDQDHMVFLEDNAAPASHPARMTFTKVDDTHYDHLAETDEGKGYHTVYRKTCEKKPS